jgi:hypothetical protein
MFGEHKKETQQRFFAKVIKKTYENIIKKDIIKKQFQQSETFIRNIVLFVRASASKYWLLISCE